MYVQDSIIALLFNYAWRGAIVCAYCKYTHKYTHAIYDTNFGSGQLLFDHHEFIPLVEVFITRVVIWVRIVMFYLFIFFYFKLHTYCCRQKEEGDCCAVDHNWRHMWLGVQYVCEYNIPLRFFVYTLYNIYIYTKASHHRIELNIFF